MLVLSRKIGQQIRIGDQITLTIVKTQGKTVRIGIEAPSDVRVLRAELPSFEATPAAAISRGAEMDRSPSLKVMAERATRRQQSTGWGSGERPTRTDARHPQRWSMASMQQRVQTSIGVRPTTSAAPHER